MTTEAATAPPIEHVAGDAFASLALAAHACLEPPGDDQPSLDDAKLAIDLAAGVFERIEPRLQPGDRSAMAALLANLRMTYVKKRGS